MHQWMVLAGFVLLCFAAAAMGSGLTKVSVQTWYPTLRKPRFNPPNWVFGPVWSALYLMMATAAWLVWRSAGWTAALTLFFAQLALNVLWSALFFGMRSPGAAFAEIALLWCTIVLTTIGFAATSALAAALMLPYVAWVAFAAVLNFSIWRLNTA